MQEEASEEASEGLKREAPAINKLAKCEFMTGGLRGMIWHDCDLPQGVDFMTNHKNRFVHNLEKRFVQISTHTHSFQLL